MSVALITGANRGIGQGLAQTLSSKGYTVYGGTRNAHPDSPLNGVTYLQLDVTNDASIADAIDHIHRRHGQLDLLINNAGVNKTTATNSHPEKVSTLSSLDRHSLLGMLDINAVGPLMVAKAAVPLMTGNQCFIVNISSDRASYHTPDTAGNYGYSASKLALNMITHCLVRDLPANIATFAVHPGWVKTDMNPGGVIGPIEAAKQIIRIIEHWQPELNGQFLNNDGSLFDSHD